VTHRELSSTVTVVTGHEDPEKGESSIDWSWLAKGAGTLVILMGLSRLDETCVELMRHGKSHYTPAAVVASGTLPRQQVVSAPLYALAQAVTQAGLRSPAVIVVGECAAFPERVASLGQAALAQAV
jgi:uroporphyrinogen III methyltransferase/synthase